MNLPQRDTSPRIPALDTAPVFCQNRRVKRSCGSAGESRFVLVSSLFFHARDDIAASISNAEEWERWLENKV